MAAVPNKQYSGSILDSFLPRQNVQSTTNTSQTDQTQLNSTAVNQLIKNMMESNSGLASLLTQQSGAGIYNSSTSKLLADNLAANVAGTVAVAGAPKTSAKTVVSNTPSANPDPKYALGMQIASGLVGKLLGGGSNGSGNNAFSDLLNSVLGNNNKQRQDGSSSSDPTTFDSNSMAPTLSLNSGMLNLGDSASGNLPGSGVSYDGGGSSNLDFSSLFDGLFGNSSGSGNSGSTDLSGFNFGGNGGLSYSPSNNFGSGSGGGSSFSLGSNGASIGFNF